MPSVCVCVCVCVCVLDSSEKRNKIWGMCNEEQTEIEEREIQRVRDK